MDRQGADCGRSAERDCLKDSGAEPQKTKGEIKWRCTTSPAGQSRTSNRRERIVKGRCRAGVYSQPAECVNGFSYEHAKIVKEGSTTPLLSN
jgi:hypothetical protein